MIHRKITASSTVRMTAVSTLAVMLAVGAVPFSVQAQEAAVQLNIPRQSLGAALLQLGQQTSLQLLYNVGVVQGWTAPEIQGRFTPEQALQQLLSGTNIAFERNGNTITLTRKLAQSQSQLTTVTVLGNADAALTSYIAKTDSATKLNTPLIETPRAISVVTAEQIKTQAPRSLEQALAYTSGVITENGGGGDTRMTGAIIRGFSDGSAYYKDGLKQLSAGSYGSWNDPVSELESIEVLKGPASVYYGQGRPGGVVNVVTKKPEASHINSVGLSYGRYNRVEATADLGGAIDSDNKVLYRLNILGRDSDARTIDSRDDRFAIAPSLLWNISDKTRITFRSQFSQEKGTPKTWWPSLFVSPAVMELPTEWTAGEPAFDHFNRDTKAIGYAFEHDTDNGWRLRQNLRYSVIDIDYAHVYASSVQADGKTVDRGSLVQKTNGKTLTIDNRIEKDFNWGELHHTFALGLDYLKYQERGGLGFGFDVPTLNMRNPVYGQYVPTPAMDESNLDLEQTGIYTLNQFKLGRWIANLSLRHDSAKTTQTSTTQPTISDTALTGSAGLLYLFDSGFAPYASYATSFDPATGKQFNGTPFQPRKGVQYEVGLKYQPPGSAAFITASLFEITQSNVTTNDPDHPRFSIQTGEVRSRGFELEGKLQPTREIAILANYTYVDPKTTKSMDPQQIGRQAVQTVKNTASVWVDYRPQQLPGVMVAGGVRYRGKAFFGKSPAGTDYFDQPFTLADAALAYETSRYRIALNVNNLFNKKYFTSTFRGASREAVLSANYYW